MKKNIIIAAIAAASALLLSVSCQKENQPESQNGINGGAKTFTATIEQGLTKTTLTTDYKVNWTTGDKININGKSYTATPKDDATRADFTADDGEATPDGNKKFKAIYPSTLYVTDHFELPDAQEYTAGEFNAPMYAESETQTLPFKNICAVLAIKVTSEDITSLKSIKVKSDKAMYGTFTVNDDKAVLADATDAGKAVTLESASALTLDATGTTFYIAIPEQTYSYLKIYLSEDGTLYKRAMITKKTVGTVSCNKIYSIDYQTNAVQLYADGPYWATMNLGATTVATSYSTCYGDLYQWGSVNTLYEGSPYTSATAGSFTWKTDKTSGFVSTNREYKGNDDLSDATNDVVKKTYPGTNWRMPTKQEFQDLYDACVGTDGYDKTTKPTTGKPTSNGVYWCDSYDGVAGVLFYDGTNVLFFPAAGFGTETDLYAGDSGNYWSSSPKGTGVDAYYLCFDSSDVDPLSNDDRSFGNSVRPVSD